MSTVYKRMFIFLFSMDGIGGARLGMYLVHPNVVAYH
jgi:hypothetical protein